jgi:hypothetical protein
MPRRPPGISEPVRLDANDTGTRTGLGRREQERQYTAAEFVERRALEVELQADEDEERRRKREVRRPGSACVSSGGWPHGPAGSKGAGGVESAGQRRVDGAAAQLLTRAQGHWKLGARPT